MRLQLWSGLAAANGAPTARATGSITTVAVASLVDGETFTLNDGFSALVFEFDVNGSGVTAGRIQVNVSTDTTADQVRDRVITAINNARHPVDGFRDFAITAVSGGAATVSLKNDFPGIQGNTTQSETVANGGFAVTNMAGATAAIPLAYGAQPGKAEEGFHRSNLAGPLRLGIVSTAGSGTMTVTPKLWGYSPVEGEFMPVGTSTTDANRGIVNEATAIGETGTDLIRFTQIIDNLLEFTHVYLEAGTGVTGTFNAFLTTQAGM